MTPKLRAEYALQQKERILEAAYELFAERGYDRTTMRELASRMGMTTGVLYAHFNSKDEIIRALAERSRDRSKDLMDILSREDTMREALRALLTMLAEYRDDDPTCVGARANINLLAEATRRESIREEASELYQRTTEIFTRLAEDAVERRELDAGLEPTAVGALMSALFLGLQTESILLGDTDVARHLAAISNVLLRNIWNDRGEST